MSYIEIVNVKSVKWNCQPTEDKHYKIYVRIHAKTKEKDGFFLLKITLADPLQDKRTREDPADPMFKDDEPPFQYRIDRRDHRLLKFKLVTDLHLVKKKLYPHTTISVNLFMLRGMYIKSIRLSDTFGESGLFHQLGLEFDNFVKETRSAIGLYTPPEKPEDVLKTLRNRFGQMTLDVSLNILQDRSQMPKLGAPIEQQITFPKLDVEPFDAPSNPVLKALRHFRVEYIPNGVRITWVATQQTLTLSIPDLKIPNCGFAFAFNENFKPTQQDAFGFLAYNDLLHIKYSGDVQISLSDIPAPKTGAGRNPVSYKWLYDRYFLDPVAWAKNNYPVNFLENRLGDPVFVRNPKVHREKKHALFFRLQKVPSVAELPGPHSEFKVKKNDDEAPKNWSSYYTEKKVPTFLKLIIDTGIGMIPFAGDIVDFTEFNHMLATGKDRYDEEVDDTDILIAGLASIPVLGIGADAVKFFRKLK